MSIPTAQRHAVLAEAVAALTQAAERLAATHHGIDELFPLASDVLDRLSEQERERLDAYAIRYARCQDLLFPAMRALARAQLEPAADGGFLQVFGLMQKQGIATTTDDWERQRDLRNAIGHEYPDSSAIADVLNALRAATPEVLQYVENVRRSAAHLLATRPS